jgi:hypothetical protein
MESKKHCATPADDSNSHLVFDAVLHEQQTFFLKRYNRLMWLFRIYL